MVQLTLRRLAEGSEHPCIVRQRSSNRLEIQLQDPSADFPMRTEVEILAPGTLLLGTLLARSGDNLSILLEHEVDLPWLERILDMWQRAEAT